jgi:hypothetical protein
MKVKAVNFVQELKKALLMLLNVILNMRNDVANPHVKIRVTKPFMKYHVVGRM